MEMEMDVEMARRLPLLLINFRLVDKLEPSTGPNLKAIGIKDTSKARPFRSLCLCVGEGCVVVMVMVMVMVMAIAMAIAVGMGGINQKQTESGVLTIGQPPFSHCS